MSKLFQARAYLSYWLEAVDEHSLHSPFFFDLYTRVIKEAYKSASKDAEALRKKLRHDTRTVYVNDLGRGASFTAHHTRRIGDIARTSLTPPKFSRLYQRLISHLKARTVVELGTCLGINTLYLAAGNTARVYTFEGAEALASIARDNFRAAGTENITLIEGNIDTTLPAFLDRAGKIDLVLADANHRYAATLNYFKWLLPFMHAGSMMIFDDIHTSREMTDAWKAIQTHTLVYGSVDLFRCGVAFFDPALNRQHAILRF